MIYIIPALQAHYGVKEGLTIVGTSITEWPYDEPLPSIEELENLVTAYEESIAYKEQRRKAYPSIPDQLDKIFHEGLDAWKAEIQAIKDLYPKPVN